MGRIVALDVGDARIGIAVSDPMKIVANPLNTLFRKKTDEDFEEIARIVREQDAELVVCGLPKSMNNQENAQTAKTREFAEKLKAIFRCPLNFSTSDLRRCRRSALLSRAECGAKTEKTSSTRWRRQ